MVRYIYGTRPTIPHQLKEAAPDLIVLIEEMWAHDFRKRPPFSAIVPRLQAMADVVTVLEATPEGGVYDEAGDPADALEAHAYSAVQHSKAGIADPMRKAQKDLSMMAAQVQAQSLAIAELKAKLITTATEGDGDEVNEYGILGGMFICKLPW